MTTNMKQNNKKKRKRKVVIAVILSAVATGGAFASAATLGGITSKSLGADTAVVAACQTDGLINLAYTNAYSPTTGVYETTDVVLTGVAAGCNGKAIQLTLKGSGGLTAVATGDPINAVTGTTTVHLGTAVSANLVYGAAVVITG